MNYLCLYRRLPDNIFFNYIVTICKGIYYHFSDSFYLRIGRRNSKHINTSNPLVSVYIPTFNRSDLLLTRSIPSVLRQTYTNFELIIVSDGSTDETENQVLAINDPRIKFYKIDRNAFYRYPNKSIYHWFSGPVVAANFALTKVSGYWIARIDDDDIWTNDHLEKLVKFATSGGFEFVSSDYQIEQDGISKIISAKNDVINIGGTQTWLYRSYLKKIKYNIDCWRKKINRVNDTDLQYRFYKAGVNIGYLAEVTTLITPRPGENFIGSKAYLENQGRYEKFYGG